ncbi:MAG: hypothetical protein J7545_04815 [Roseofilum sp. SBFL]|uniref:hypothetical protein n=1 Tax=unclassified Roseofilum TaxID=2620099 RepID=UPI001B2144E7|nr:MULTISPECIES: hypothetical protein [unclassified Roseofilum]MBP0014898.1 hypothetical protein [Roseofilum sp. SID3]MBP0024231.1 hypothetical protein [Roseofilum sp. SID2]MBP0036555.1 hypothetical protein [Roseofilum sp. SID1]MBP0041284.1 hypothetical protein [Roseofilum sp. SBFL]
MIKFHKGKFLFKSEALLEEFIWLHLSKLLDLNPVAKQYYINDKNRSDILAVDPQNRLAIIELKNSGGKASLDQLLRYKKALMRHHPDGEEFAQVDWKQEFSLVSIAADFSTPAKEYAAHNMPNSLLLQYEIDRTQDNRYCLILRDLDGKLYRKQDIEVDEDSLFDSLPPFLQAYLLTQPEIKDRILEIIQKILDYHPRIQFEAEANRYYDTKDLKFGKFNKQGKMIHHKTCARFSYYCPPKHQEIRLSLSVRLPTMWIIPKRYNFTQRGKIIGGVTIWTDDFCYVTKLTDPNVWMSKRYNLELRYPFNKEQIYDTFEDYYINYRKQMKSRQKLRPITHDDFKSVDSVIEMALEDWSVR